MAAMSDDNLDLEPITPSRRRQPKDHLKTAAQSSLGSNTERYGVTAAMAEALVDIAEELRLIRIELQSKEA